MDQQDGRQRLRAGCFGADNVHCDALADVGIFDVLFVKNIGGHLGPTSGGTEEDKEDG
jgi:hypothetical protein